MKIYEYIYTYFLNTSLTNYESEISNLDWTNKDLFQFKFTAEQVKCMKEIQEDMSKEKAMYRLPQGDVGTGKTACAMYALYLAVNNAHQAAVMAPTEILARQHFVTISKVFMPLGFNVRLLVSGMDEKSKQKIRKEIASGETEIIIGTHSLIQESSEYKDLGLIVIDEQHKFGVEQRKAFSGKGKNADTLVMTATPIPRSLVLTVFGDMDISVIREKPLDRKPVTTYWVDEEKREEIYAFIKSEIDKGHQAFLVYPRIEEKENTGLKSVNEMYVHFKEDIFSDKKVALIHGKLKSEEKDKIMTDFRKKKYDILIATTVIEVGVDVPNVTVMLIEHAQRYGLAQLHQLRGRIGRGEFHSYCILMGDVKTEAAYERLKTLSETSDGFLIAEKDLDIRGPGELLGTKQSGLAELRVGDIARDFSVMEEARRDAFGVVERDPKLSDADNIMLKQYIIEKFKRKKDENNSR